MVALQLQTDLLIPPGFPYAACIVYRHFREAPTHAVLFPEEVLRSYPVILSCRHRGRNFFDPVFFSVSSVQIICALCLPTWPATFSLDCGLSSPSPVIPSLLKGSITPCKIIYSVSSLIKISVQSMSSPGLTMHTVLSLWNFINARFSHLNLKIEYEPFFILIIP